MEEEKIEDKKEDIIAKRGDRANAEPDSENESFMKRDCLVSVIFERHIAEEEEREQG